MNTTHAITTAQAELIEKKLARLRSLLERMLPPEGMGNNVSVLRARIERIQRKGWEIEHTSADFGMNSSPFHRLALGIWAAENVATGEADPSKLVFLDNVESIVKQNLLSWGHDGLRFAHQCAELHGILEFVTAGAVDDA